MALLNAADAMEQENIDEIIKLARLAGSQVHTYLVFIGDSWTPDPLTRGRRLPWPYLLSHQMKDRPRSSNSRILHLRRCAKGVQSPWPKPPPQSGARAGACLDRDQRPVAASSGTSSGSC